MEFDFTDKAEYDEIMRELYDLGKHNANVTAARLWGAMKNCEGQTTLHLNI